MTNREEVAKKLRKVNQGYGGWSITSDNAIYEIGKAIYAQGKPLDFFFNRLADLIDPTCKYLPIASVTWCDDNGEEHEEENLEEPGYSENAYCSVCNYEMMTGEEGWFDYEHEEHGNRLIPNFNYCPNCGARVVRDEE